MVVKDLILLFLGLFRLLLIPQSWILVKSLVPNFVFTFGLHGATKLVRFIVLYLCMFILRSVTYLRVRIYADKW